MTLLTISNLVAWSAQAAVIIGAALLTMRLIALDVPAVRYTLLRIVLAICLLLPLLQPRMQEIGDLEGRVSMAAEATVLAEAGVAGRSRTDFSLPSLGAWATALTIVLGAGAVARFLWIGVGALRLRRLRCAGEIAAPAGEHEELQSIINARATIRYVAGLGQPVTFGFRKPVVLLPESLRGRPASIQRAVLAHELWHVRRRDWIWTVMEEGIRAVFWFHPAVWMLLSRIQSAREEVVDELTILATGSRRDYVDALLAYADEAPLFAATAFARRRHLVNRLVLISKEVVMSGKRVVACGAVFAAVVLSSGWYAVRAFPLTEAQAASSAEIMSDKPGPIERRANPITPENPIPRRLHMVPPDYPRDAEAAGVRGTVTVRLTLDESGQTAETRTVGISLQFANRGFSFRNGSTGDLDRAISAMARNASGEELRSLRSIVYAVTESARRAVNQWVYAPPAAGPISFSVNVPVGLQEAATAPPPPPAAPPADERTASWQMSDGAVRVGGAIKPPTKIRNVAPEYPPDAQAAKAEGVVIIEARIEADGTVGRAHVLRSIPLLDEAALAAVRQWEFTPTLLNGQAVPVIMTVTVNFTLQ